MKKIEVWGTGDGRVFSTVRQALEHELKLLDAEGFSANTNWFYFIETVIKHREAIRTFLHHWMEEDIKEKNENDENRG